MPIDVTRTPSLWRVDFHGTVTGAEIAAAIADIEAIEASGAPTPNRLADLTRLSTREFPAEVMRSFASKRRSAALSHDVKTAIVAPTAATLGFARMFQMLNDNPRIKIRIFDNEGDALRWLTAD